MSTGAADASLAGEGCLVVVLVGQEKNRYGLTDPSSFWPVCKPSTAVVEK